MMTLAVIIAIFSAAVVVLGQDDEYVARARELHLLYPLVDGHNDLPYQWKVRVNNQIELLDIGEPQPSIHTDIQRLRQGGVGAQFWSVYVSCSTKDLDAVRATMDQIDVVKRMVERYPDTFEIAYTADDVERIHAEGKIASMFGIEGGHSIDNSLGALRMFADMTRDGNRFPANLYMTLTHNCDLLWCDAHTGTSPNNGISEFGKKVIFEMNRAGVIVDISHVTADVMRQALSASLAPVIFSHSSVYSLCSNTRNAPDDVLLLVRETRSVIMITFVCSFVVPEGVPDINDVANHIDYVKNLIGVDYVGIGGDYDGVDCLPTGLEDVSGYPYLTAELLRRGYSDEDIRKVIGGNVLRVMREVSAIAQELQNGTLAQEDFIAVDNPCRSSAVLPLYDNDNEDNDIIVSNSTSGAH